MKIGCCSVNFRQLPLEETLERVRRAGYNYIEFEANLSWCNHADPRNNDPYKFRELVLGKYGFKEITGMGSHRELMQDPLAVDDISYNIKWARKAGIPIVITGEGSKAEGMSDEDAFTVLKKNLTELVRVAEENRVILALEPHGYFSLQLGGLPKILSLIDSPWLKVNFDTANPHRGDYVGTDRSGYRWRIKANSTGDEIATLKTVASQVRHVHAKDVIGKDAVTLGTGEVRFKECIKILAENGYKGALSFQTEGGDPDIIQDMLINSREYLRKIFLELNISEQ